MKSGVAKGRRTAERCWAVLRTEERIEEHQQTTGEQTLGHVHFSFC